MTWRAGRPGTGAAAASSSHAGASRRSGRRIPRSPLSQPFRILVAEDDESSLEAIALLLEQDERFTVAARARNGRDAVELAARLKPDAVLMDIEMPELDGVEATRLLRSAAPALPIVAVSGHDYEERALEMREAGAADYVRKARLVDELPHALAALLE